MNNINLNNAVEAFILKAEKALHEYADILQLKHKETRIEDEKEKNYTVLKELIALDEISNTNLRRLKRMVERLSIDDGMYLPEKEKKHLINLILKTNNSVNLINQIRGSDDKTVANQADNTLNIIDKYKMLSAS